ncbi:hypothetical protein [Streptomyces rimosus]|uniref:hypothetical protein n=1 Tax=Streptomyces rimosus TaxID=1927 RepID=UPI000AFB0C15|nr:hypothetical protein [Streptomyces rimosus]
MAAAWVAELTGPDDVAAITGRVRATLGTISRPLAFAALWAVEQALPEYRSSALAWLGRTEEVEAEARRACQTEQGRRWYRHHPNGADADAAAMKAAEAACARHRAQELAGEVAEPDSPGTVRAGRLVV